MKTITPFLLSRLKDIDIFEKLRAFFDQGCVKAAGVRALHMTHVMRNGDGHTDDAPQFLIVDNGQRRLLHKEQMTNDLIVPERLIRDINTHFTTDFLYISSQGINSLVFPDFCHFQAQNILAEIRAAHRISRDFQNSTWARAASSTFRFAPPTNAHALLQLATQIEQSQLLMDELHPQTNKDLLEQDWAIAPVDAHQLQNAMEN
jgi:hypothetical protein